MSNLGIKVHFHKPELSSVYQPLCPWTIMTLWSQRQGDTVLLCGLSWSAKGALDGKAIVHCCVVSVHLGYVRRPRGRAETQNKIVWLLPQCSPLRSTLLTLEQCYTFYVGKKGGSICLYFLWSTFSLLGKAVSMWKVWKQSFIFGLDFLSPSVNCQQMPLNKAPMIAVATFSIPANLTTRKGTLMGFLPLLLPLCDFRICFANGYWACLCTALMPNAGFWLLLYLHGCRTDGDQITRVTVGRQKKCLAWEPFSGQHAERGTPAYVVRGITAIKAWMLLLLLSTWHRLCPVESTGIPTLKPGITRGEIWCHSICVELSTPKAENDLGGAEYGIHPVLLWYISYLDLECPYEHCRQVKVLEQRKCSSLGHYAQVWPAGSSGLFTSELVHSEINNL